MKQITRIQSVYKDFGMTMLFHTEEHWLHRDQVSPAINDVPFKHYHQEAKNMSSH